MIELLNIIKKEAAILHDDESRSLYRNMVTNFENGTIDSNTIIQDYKNKDSKILQIFNSILTHVTKGIAKYGPDFLWVLYEYLPHGELSNTLSQHFTSSNVVRFALSSLNSPNKILDPMAGHGAFLRSACEHYPKTASCTGVDIDDLPLLAARLILDQKVTLVNEDIFQWALTQVENDPDFSFDAIVGNPAFVSYQELQNIGDYANQSGDYRKFLVDTIHSLCRLTPYESEIRKLLTAWSGYSDLSAYVLILSWLLLEENGKMVFVITDHWRKRNYGDPIKKFLFENGTVDAIITQKNVNWFPSLQIPTSIIVYTKRKRSDRQSSLGVPIIDILGSDLLSVKHNIETEFDEDFWIWISQLDSNLQHDEIRVQFKKWVNETNQDQFPYVNQVELPFQLQDKSLRTYNSVGWSVHQGLRTGCNEFFYIKRINENQFQATYTRSGKKQQKLFDLPAEDQYPAIHKISHIDPLLLTKQNADVYLLDLNGQVLLRDYLEVISRYPDEWLEYWDYASQIIIRKELEDYLLESEKYPYEGKGKGKKPVPQLSAVRTNVFKPSIKINKSIPRPPSNWYHVKIMPRHYGHIILPRVTGGPLRAYLVDQDDKILTDANFVTLIPKDPSISDELLWIWMNSNLFRLIVEKSGIVMGGGALKVETSLVKKIPVPFELLMENRVSLEFLIDKLKKPHSDEDLLCVGAEIDEILLGTSLEIKNELVDCIIKRKKR